MRDVCDCFKQVGGLTVAGAWRYVLCRVDRANVTRRCLENVCVVRRIMSVTCVYSHIGSCLQRCSDKCLRTQSVIYIYTHTQRGNIFVFPALPLRRYEFHMCEQPTKPAAHNRRSIHHACISSAVAPFQLGGVYIPVKCFTLFPATPLNTPWNIPWNIRIPYHNSTANAAGTPRTGVRAYPVPLYSMRINVSFVLYYVHNEASENITIKM